MESFKLSLGVKTDPVEYRFSYEWLFRIMAEEGIFRIQLGTFFELYQLPDDYFKSLRRQAEDFGIEICSVFTAHRELGGFFREEREWVEVARKNYERLIEVGKILGARSVGSNPGAILRDRMGLKKSGMDCYVENMKSLMKKAYLEGIEWLTIEPMSCLAEPPTLPEEIDALGKELEGFHSKNPQTCRAGFCGDSSHGYADRNGKTVWDNMQLLEVCLPHLYEIHLKNTDPRFDSTFGFSEGERENGIIDIPSVRDFLFANAERLPVSELTGYFETGGPKTGRDYSDWLLEDQLKSSLGYLRENFCKEAGLSQIEPAKNELCLTDKKTVSHQIQIAPSIMCCDLCNLERSIRQLEEIEVDMLHIDIMDARFTPNMPLGLESLKHLRKKTFLPFDMHLMVEDNDFFVREAAELGAEQVSVHLESCRHLDRTLSLIRECGMKAGVALNPATPVESLKYILERLDFLLIMTVNPGFAGQKMVPNGIRKIADCRTFLRGAGYDLPIEVDGNVSFANIPKMAAAGADILVAGTSSLFNSDDSLKNNLVRIYEAVESGMKIGKQRERTAMEEKIEHEKVFNG